MRGVAKRNHMKTYTKKINKFYTLRLPKPLLPVNALTVDVSAWRKLSALHERHVAIKRQIDKLRMSCGLDADTLLKHYGKRARTLLVMDGNGRAIGKANVFHKAGFEMPSTWQVRLS